jgi:hypothetical protein
LISLHVAKHWVATILLLTLISGCFKSDKNLFKTESNEPLEKKNFFRTLFSPILTPPTDCAAKIENARLTAFKSSVYPIVVNRCAGCHGSSQTPLFAAADALKAFQAAQSRINEDAPEASRLAIQSANGHCGTANCRGSSAEMETAIISFVSKSKENIALLETSCGNDESSPGTDMKD